MLIPTGCTFIFSNAIFINFFSYLLKCKMFAGELNHRERCVYIIGMVSKSLHMDTHQQVHRMKELVENETGRPIILHVPYVSICWNVRFDWPDEHAFKSLLNKELFLFENENR